MGTGRGVVGADVIIGRREEEELEVEGMTIGVKLGVETEVSVRGKSEKVVGIEVVGNVRGGIELGVKAGGVKLGIGTGV